MNAPHSDTDGGTEAVYTLTREGARSIDRAAVEEYGLPNIVLMENAAGAVEAEAIDALDGVDGLVLLCCGPGNNGGDGLAAARRLHNAGVRVAIALCADEAALKGDAATHLRVAKKMDLPLRVVRSAKDLDMLVAATEEPAMIIDALFGTGLDRPLDGPAAAAVHWINDREGDGVFVLAVDLPSGLDADTGEALGGLAVRADITVALGGVKKGMLAESAGDYTGDVVIGDLGAPIELLERFGTLYDESNG